MHLDFLYIIIEESRSGFVFVDENKQNLNKGNAWLRPVMFFYVKTTSWIIFPLVLGLIFGGYVGKSTGSQTLFFGIVFLGFLITCLGIYREIRQYKKDLEKNKNL